MTTITDYSQKELPQNLRDMLDGKHDGRALDGKSLAQDVRDLGAAKERVKALLYIEGKITGADLYTLAADEIESLRAQVEDHIANALVRANRQAILVEALRHIESASLDTTALQLSARALNTIEEPQP
jgi:hypothetical protein